MTEEPDEEKSHARQQRELLYDMHGTEIGMLANVEGILKDMDQSRNQKRNGLSGYLQISYLLHTTNLQIKKERHHRRGQPPPPPPPPPRPVPRFTSDTRKRLKEPTVSPEVTVAKKPEEKELKTSRKQEEWSQVLTRKEPKPKELGITVQGIRKTRSKDLLVEMRCAANNRDRLDSAFRDVVGEQGTIRHLFPMLQVKILDLNPTTEKAEVEEAVRSCLHTDPSADVKVSLARRPLRRELEEVCALRLLKIDPH